MLFSDPVFLFYFLPLVLILHGLANWFEKTKSYGEIARLVLVISTLIFYGFKEPWWLVPFFTTIFIDYWLASLIAQSTNDKKNRFFCSASVVSNLALLGFFKYWLFIIRRVANLNPTLAGYFPVPTLNQIALGLPAGISFYTFESLSFVIDVYRKEIKPPKNLLTYLSFLAMFPRFIAGPIVRYKDIGRQLESYAGMDVEKGLSTFFVGFFLKAGFADNFAIFTHYAFQTIARPTFLAAWVGTIAYSMQIYFDFFGYSLMAIGLGQCLGFQFPRNFNNPYLASSLSDFWRRWHISLSSWLRDYLYIPMGGSQRGTIRTYINLFLTMLLGGLWHGAQGTFIAWGAWHGGFLCFERMGALSPLKSRSIRQVVTLLIVAFGWVFFKATSVTSALRIILAMLSPFSLEFNAEALTAHPLSLLFCIAGLIYCFGSRKIANKISTVTHQIPDYWLKTGSLGLGLVSIILQSSSQVIPFLYFQF